MGEALGDKEGVEEDLAAVGGALVLPGLDLKGGLFQKARKRVLEDDGRVDVALDSIEIRVKFLFGCDETIKFDTIGVVLGVKHHIEPGGDVFDSSKAICGHFGFGFVQEIEQDELAFDG